MPGGTDKEKLRDSYLLLDVNTLHAVVSASVTEALEKRSSVDHDMHKEHHKWIQEQITEKQKKIERTKEWYSKVQATVIGGLVLAIFLGIGRVLVDIGQSVLDLIHTSTK